MALPLLGAVASAALPAAASAFGVHQQNRAQRRMMREQMGFQEEMSNTAWQRAVQDMRLAGINPMLAFSQGGASSPAGGMAEQQDMLGPAVSSAQHARRLNQEMRIMREQEQLVRDQQQGARASAQQAHATAQHQHSQREMVDALLEAGMPRAQVENLNAIIRQHNIQSRTGELQLPYWENMAKIEGADAGQVGSILRWLLQVIGGRRQ